MTGSVYVQYGCGLSAPAGWLNFDASPRLRLERVPGLGALLGASLGRLFPASVRYGDIVRGLGLPDGAARAVYCSHVLEHLARDDVPRALANTYRLLAPGGVFRLVVPDLEWRAARYLEARRAGAGDAADRLMEALELGTRRRASDPVSLLRQAFGRSRHCWMYDFAGLRALLAEAGFVAIRRCALGDAADPMFGAVEDPARFQAGDARELAIEAVRPPADGVAELAPEER